MVTSSVLPSAHQAFVIFRLFICSKVLLSRLNDRWIVVNTNTYPHASLNHVWSVVIANTIDIEAIFITRREVVLSDSNQCTHVFDLYDL